MTVAHPHYEALLATLQRRFAAHPHRHPNMQWSLVLERIARQPERMCTLLAMEENGGEPDVTGFDPERGTVTFTDCCAESPAGRRSLCYDEAALHARKHNKPAGSAMGLATTMGATLLDEAQYLHLQTLGTFDQKTSSWLRTPDDIRAKGGALFGDSRYGRVFVYHNGAESYYAARGFRCFVEV